MDPDALLDYALFQLTPTRTRCDLVVVCGGKSEKIASGLVEPFVSHLKFAKDQIPKGGYSITLRPPKTDASWFTKSTFQRFVRFVSTPEVLERFARLEKEISQIESSVEPNEFANSNGAGQADEGSMAASNGITKQSTNSSKLKGETDGNDDPVQEENSKICLQRLLETRKALLRKEQAMAYARALAAGFELDNLDDLILFSDAFGASRLREACTEFKELCKKKLTDGLWMDELAAMQAFSQSDLSFSGTSGIILASESTPLYQNNMSSFQNNGSSDVSPDSTVTQANSDSTKDNNVPASDQIPHSAKVPVQLPWPNQIPQYMFNFQGPGQQMPPYQAYPYPAMQPVPQFYPGNMHWPPNMDESSGGPTQKPDHLWHQRSSSSRKKEKSPNVEGPKTSQEDERSGSSDSDIGTDSEAITYKKKDRKKSSKTVVIRNINYIAPKRRNGENDGDSADSSSVEDELFLDEDFLKQNVEDVVGSLEKHGKTNSKNKKRGGNKNSNFVNGSNGDLDNDHNTSQGGKGNENWDSFQNLLMREKEVEGQQPLDVLDEHCAIKSTVDGDTSNTNALSVHSDLEKVKTRQTFGTDSFVVTERNEANEGRVNLEDFGSGETFRPSMKRRDSVEEALLFPRRLEESRSNIVGALPDFGKDSSIIKNGKGEDWFIVNHSVKSESHGVNIEQTMFDGGYALSSEGDRSQMEVSKKIIPIDDSFMIQSQKSIDDQYNAHWKTDISLVSDLIVPENGTPHASEKKIGVSGSYEPDDLSVVLSRDSGFDSVGLSWSAEMDYGGEAAFTEADKKPSAVETNGLVEENTPTDSKSTNDKNSGKNNSVKQSKTKGLQGSLAKNKFDVLSKSKKPFATNRPVVQKSKLEKEEEARKKMEELAIQRQKRIAERTAASGLTPAASKKVPMASPKPRPQSNQISPKLGITNSAKNRQIKV